MCFIVIQGSEIKKFEISIDNCSLIYLKLILFFKCSKFAIVI